MVNLNIYSVKNMQLFADSYQYKNHILKTVSGLGISNDVFEKLFAQVFVAIYEKEKLLQCFLSIHQIELSKKILEELKGIKKENKASFLNFFEEYQKLNSDLS